MGRRLEDLLEPDEQVLYRDPTRWVPELWYADLALLALAIAVSVVSEKVLFAVVFLVYCGLGWLFHAIRALTSWTTLTDRRILQNSGWRTPEIEDIHLADVTQVTFLPSGYPGTVRLQTRDRGETDLEPLKEPQPFAVAVSEAAGLERPALVGCLMSIGRYNYSVGGMLIASLLMLGYAYLAWFVLSEVVAEGTILYGLLVVLVGPLSAVLVLGLGVGIGVHLANLVGIGLLRRIATFEQARNALYMGQWVDASHRPRARIFRLYQRWISFLYGRPVNGEAGAESRNGG